MKMYRQGDVLLCAVKGIPKTAKKQETENRIVLAYGEVTGHAHAIEDLEAVDVYVGPEGRLYLRVKAPVTVRHEEHAPITLPGGVYERIIQREYAPEAIRNVQD